MRGLRLAVGLLTRLPVRVEPISGDSLASSIPWYPAVGAVVGGLVGLTAYGAALVVPDFAAAVLAVAMGIVLTGALHLDGLADVFDGFVGGHDRERRLEIMKDPRLGTYGAAALFVALALQAAWLASLTERALVVVAVAAAGAASRAATVVVMGGSKPAAAGLGATHGAATTRSGAMLAGLLGVAAGAALGPGGVAGILAAALAAGAMAAWSRRAIGGITGDVLGAVQVVSELAFLGTVVGVQRWWW